MAKSSTTEKRRPVHEVRHRNIRATIWKNDTLKGPMYNVTVSRSYRDGEYWRDSNSFSFTDLMTVAKALSDAHSIISALQAKDRAAARRAHDGTRESS